MNLSALPELLLAWVKTQGAALLQGNKAEQAAPFKVGAEYEGKVLDLLPTGRYLVQVAGQKLDMGLPGNTQTGDSVRLTFMNAGPRPTFLLQQGPVTPAQNVQISNTAQQVNALMRLAQPAAPATMALSPSAVAQPQTPPQAMGQLPQAASAQATRQIADYVAAATAAGVDAVATAPGKPLVASAAPATAAVPLQPTVAASRAAAAAQVIQALPSGQAAQASAASRPIVANVLMLQGYTAAPTNAPTAVASANTALLGQAVDQLRAAVASSTTLRATVLADPATPSDHLLPTRLAQTLRESGLFYEAHLARWTKGTYPFEAILNEPQARLARGALPMPGLAELGGMPEEAARMAGRQLHMLEGGPFLWQGFAWPGQWMDWLVEERQAGRGDGQEGEPGNQWHTELRLTLPRMGTVQAQLSLRGRDINLRLRVSEPATAAALTAALPDLQRGLEASGLRAVGLAVAGEAG